MSLVPALPGWCQVLPKTLPKHCSRDYSKERSRASSKESSRPANSKRLFTKTALHWCDQHSISIASKAVPLSSFCKSISLLSGELKRPRNSGASRPNIASKRFPLLDIGKVHSQCAFFRATWVFNEHCSFTPHIRRTSLRGRVAGV